MKSSTCGCVTSLRRALARESDCRAAPVAISVVLALLVLLGASGCGNGSAGTTSTVSTEAAAPVSTEPATEAAAAPEMANVDLVMDWLPWVLDIPIDVAQAKGFYADAGLTVTQIIPTGPTDVVKFVSTGKSQFGLYYAPDILMARAEGAPVISVATLMAHAPVGLAFKPGTSAKSPADLKGKTVAVPLIPSTRASYESMLAAGGVDPASVTLVDPGFELVAPLLAGTYDAVAVTAFGELIQANLTADPDLSYLDFRDWGTPDFAFLNIVTSEEMGSKSPNTVRAFVRATLAGLDYAVEHPEEAVDLYVAAHPELDRDTLLAQWRAAMPDLASTSTERATGAQDVKSWSALQDWMVKVKLLAEPQDPASAVTDTFLP